MTGKSGKSTRRNSLLLAGDWVAFGTGMSFVSSVTILPAFVKNFTDSDLAVGLITTIWVLGFSMPRFLVANYVEGLSRVKPYILRLTAGERIPWLVLGLLVFFTGSTKSPWILPVFFLLLVVVASTGGLLMPAWVDLIARVVPQRIRGKYFGLINAVSAALGALAGLAAGVFLDVFGFPDGFAFCFLAGFLLVATSWGFFALVQDPGREPVSPRIGLGTYLRRLPTVLRGDKDFSLFIVSQVLLSFIRMATAFYTAYAIDLLHPTGEQIGAFTFIFLGSQALTNLPWGHLGDKKGHKLALQLSYICGIAAAVTAAFARSIPAFYLVFALDGAAFSAQMVSFLSLVLEFAGPENRPTYLAFSALISPFTAVAPLVGGVLLGFYQYSSVFLLAAAITGVGFLILTAVRDPRSRSKVEE